MTEKRKAIFIASKEGVIEKRVRLSELIANRPFWNSKKEAEPAHLQLKKGDRVTLYEVKGNKIISFRTRKIDKNPLVFASKAEAISMTKEAEITLDYTITRNNIAVFINGETYNISAADKRYPKVAKSCLDADAVGIMDLFNLKHHVKNAGLDLDNEEAPNAFVDKVVDVVKNDQSIVIKKFYERLAKNPSKNPKTNLYKFLSHHKTIFVDDGRFIAYKYVRSDFMDSHSGTKDYTPGNVVTQPRGTVVEDENETCASGLHVGSWNFVKGYGTLLLCVIDPEDVVSVPKDYSGQKMRCCKVTSVMQISRPLDGNIVAADYIKSNMGKKLGD